MSLSKSKALAGAALLAAVGLTSCSGKDQFPPICPSLALLADTADLTSYKSGGSDITDLLLDARITAVPATCTRGSDTLVKTVMHVDVAVQRGPANPSRTATVPIFVAVMDGETIVDRQDYTLNATFDSNVDRTRVSSSDITLNIPTSRDKTAAAYKIYIGFNLTPEQLALNRKRGPR